MNTLWPRALGILALAAAMAFAYGEQTPAPARTTTAPEAIHTALITAGTAPTARTAMLRALNAIAVHRG
jgi:hypothetical protein